MNVSLGKYYFSYDDYKYYLTLSLLFESGRLYNSNNVKVITWKSTGFSAKEIKPTDIAIIPAVKYSNVDKISWLLCFRKIKTFFFI